MWNVPLFFFKEEEKQETHLNSKFFNPSSWFCAWTDDACNSERFKPLGGLRIQGGGNQRRWRGRARHAIKTDSNRSSRYPFQFVVSFRNKLISPTWRMWFIRYLRCSMWRADRFFVSMLWLHSRMQKSVSHLYCHFFHLCQHNVYRSNDNSYKVIKCKTANREHLDNIYIKNYKKREVWRGKWKLSLHFLKHSSIHTCITLVCQNSEKIINWEREKKRKRKWPIDTEGIGGMTCLFWAG